MKKLMLIMAVALTAASCEIDYNSPRSSYEGLRKYEKDNIVIKPADWLISETPEGNFDYFYADVSVPAFTWEMLNHGFYYSYMKYNDGNILVSEGLGISIHLEYLDEGDGLLHPFTETVGCSYSEGEIRYVLSRSDFYDGRPEGNYVFRFVVLW